MIKRMEVSSPNPSVPALPVGDLASDDPVQIQDIKGLDPVKADISGTAYATGRGQYFQGSSTGTRNLVVTIGLNPNWYDQTIAGLRKLLYGYFMPELMTKLRFFSDDYPVVEIEGVVESCEPNIFSQEPKMDVSIICHDPDFVEVDATIIKGIGTNALLDGDPTEYEFDYDGSAPAGFRIRVTNSEYNEEYTGPLAVVHDDFFDREFVLIDEVVIDNDQYFYLTTMPRVRRVSTRDDEGEIVNLLKRMSTDSEWPKLRPGTNVLAVSAMESNLRFELVYFARYGGL